MIASLHSGHTLFVDRNSGGRSFRGLVVDAGIKIVLHDEHFPVPAQGEKNIGDHEWLHIIGNLGWLIVTGDKHTIKEDLFIRALPKSNAYVFLLNALNGASPKGKAELIIDAYPKMLGLISAVPRPAVWFFERNGTIKLVPWREKLRKIEARSPT